MTPKQIAALEILSAKATPGPWFVGAQNDGLYIIDRSPSPAPYDGPVPQECGPNVIATPNSGMAGHEANAAFIAAARDAVPRLVAIIAAQKAEIEKLRSENVQMRAAHNDGAEVVSQLRRDVEEMCRSAGVNLDGLELKDD